MVLVRVHRVSSVRDPETGRYGKMIELVEERRVQAAARVSGMPSESFMIQSMLQDLASYLQSMGFMLGSAIKPKMTLFLTEEEYEMLGVKLDVNEVYELEFKDGTITFRRAYD
ncbi:MAG: arcadin 1 [Thaumarchaeota archaeon]|nr:arcadin 1 [Nitrososphaerota archaeon]